MKQCVKPCAGDWTPQEACKAWQTVPQGEEMPELLLKVEGALSKGNHFFIPKGIAKGGGPLPHWSSQWCCRSRRGSHCSKPDAQASTQRSSGQPPPSHHVPHS